MEFILTVLLVIILFSWILGRIFPYFLKWFIKRNLGKMAEGGRFYSNVKYEQAKNKQEDDGKVVSITETQDREKLIEKDMGEYVDFEEEKIEKK